MKTVTLIVLAGTTLCSALAGQQVSPEKLAQCEARLRTQLDAARSGDQTFNLDLSGPSGGGARLRYLGMRHTYDSTDTQLTEIQAVWEELKPTVVFFEGTSNFVGPTLNASVARSAEPGVLRYLAARDSIPARSLEPPIADEVQALLRSFTAEQLVLFYVTRPLTQIRDMNRVGGKLYGKPALDSALVPLLARVRTTAALAEAVPDTAAYRAAFARWFPSLDPSDTPSGWFNPERTSAETGSKFVNDVNRGSSAFRDLYMYRLLASAWGPGVRIFAAVGRAHVPAQAEALRCALQ
jgi:hypothetical protein